MTQRHISDQRCEFFADDPESLQVEHMSDTEVMIAVEHKDGAATQLRLKVVDGYIKIDPLYVFWVDDE